MIDLEGEFEVVLAALGVGEFEWGEDVVEGDDVGAGDGVVPVDGVDEGAGEDGVDRGEVCGLGEVEAEVEFDAVGSAAGGDGSVSVVEAADVEVLFRHGVDDVDGLEPEGAGVRVWHPIGEDTPLEHGCAGGEVGSGEGGGCVSEVHFRAVAVGEVVIDDENAASGLGDGVLEIAIHAEGEWRREDLGADCAGGQHGDANPVEEGFHGFGG